MTSQQAQQAPTATATATLPNGQGTDVAAPGAVGGDFYKFASAPKAVQQQRRSKYRYPDQQEQASTK